MEVGCGHLMLTKEIVEAVESGNVAQYCVTDVSQAFIDSAQSKIERLELDYVSTCLFDINLSPEEQGRPWWERSKLALCEAPAIRRIVEDAAEPAVTDPAAQRATGPILARATA